ncbi:MAG: hypothetical protein OEM01_09655 [Desulfobulbaceae bacterium]|nr:hypothetical protein [Desulfobulbaceae bacterium]
MYSITERAIKESEVNIIRLSGQAFSTGTNGRSSPTRGPWPAAR